VSDFWGSVGREAGGELTEAEFFRTMGAVMRQPARVRPVFVTSRPVIVRALSAAACGERRAVALGLREARTPRWRWRRRRRLAVRRELTWQYVRALRATFGGALSDGAG
jgi:hypothetical protein